MPPIDFAGTINLRKITYQPEITPCNNPLANNPTITLICTKEYMAINRLPERSHLTDDHWYDWKERMNRVFTNCDITGHIDSTILWVAPDKMG